MINESVRIREITGSLTDVIILELDDADSLTGILLVGEIE